MSIHQLNDVPCEPATTTMTSFYRKRLTQTKIERSPWPKCHVSPLRGPKHTPAGPEETPAGPEHTPAGLLIVAV